MSISALVSSASASTGSQTVNPFRQLRQDFQALGSALQSGNLGAAQSAMSSLQQAQQSLPAPPSTMVSLQGGTGSGSIGGEMSTLAADLQSGNLSAAQSAYQQIQSQMQQAQGAAHHGGHGGHHGGGLGALLGASASSSTDSTSVAARSTVCSAR